MAVIYTVTRLPFKYDKVEFGGTNLTNLQVQYKEAYYPNIAMSWTNSISVSAPVNSTTIDTYIYEYDPHFAMNWGGTTNISTSTVAATPAVDSHIKLDWRNPAWGTTALVPGWTNAVALSDVSNPRVEFNEQGVKALLWNGQNITQTANVISPVVTQFQEQGVRGLLWSGQNIAQTAIINQPVYPSFEEMGSRAVLWTGTNTINPNSFTPDPKSATFQQDTTVNLNIPFTDTTFSMMNNGITYLPTTQTSVTQTTFDSKPVATFVAATALTYPTPFQITTVPFTISVMFYPTSFAGPTTAVTILTQSAGLAITAGTATTSAITSGWGISLSANAARQIMFSFKGGQLVGTSAVTLNKWYTVVVARDSTGLLTLSVNGVQENSANIGALSLEAIVDIMCVGRTNTNTQLFNGYISTVSITAE